MNLRQCRLCYYVTGVLIQMCEQCNNFCMVDDPDPDDIVVMKKPKKAAKVMTEQEKKLKAQAWAKKVEKANQKRRLVNQKYRKKRCETIANQLIMEPTEILNLSPADQREQHILEAFINQASKDKILSANYKKYDVAVAATLPQSGPAQICDLPAFARNCPSGYSSIPLAAKQGKYLSRDHNDGQWLIAYHGTSLTAADIIMKEGFKAGPGQCYSGYKNTNTHSGSVLVGKGIYCTPFINTAESYNKSNRYMCILKCRVNPYRVNIGAPGIWVLNEKTDIVPYKLLIKKKAGVN